MKCTYHGTVSTFNAVYSGIFNAKVVATEEDKVWIDVEFTMFGLPHKLRRLVSRASITLLTANEVRIE